jgi:hypothetical protein
MSKDEQIRDKSINQRRGGQLVRLPRVGGTARGDMLFSLWPMQFRQNDPRPWSQIATLQQLIAKEPSF